MSVTRKLALVGLMGSLLVGRGSQVRADDPEQLSTMLARLTAVTAALHHEGYTIAHVFVDRLGEGDTSTQTRKLYEGNFYRIVGVGGHGIADLDLELAESDGRVIATDKGAENLAIVGPYDVRRTRHFRITASAYRMEDWVASNQQCLFAVVVAFRR